jgi:hypothetical protein
MAVAISVGIVMVKRSNVMGILVSLQSLHKSYFLILLLGSPAGRPDASGRCYLAGTLTNELQDVVLGLGQFPSFQFI